MNFLVLIMMTLITSCAQLMKGHEQPVIQYRDINTFKTTCSGAAEDWGSCSRKANKTCSGGYNIEEKFQDGNGTVRTMIFSCKK